MVCRRGQISPYEESVWCWIGRRGTNPPQLRGYLFHHRTVGRIPAFPFDGFQGSRREPSVEFLVHEPTASSNCPGLGPGQQTRLLLAPPSANSVYVNGGIRFNWMSSPNVHSATCRGSESAFAMIAWVLGGPDVVTRCPN